MKINLAHTICFLVLMICCSLTIQSINTFQEPKHIRQFDTNFKERYSSDTFNYEGNAIVNQTPSGSGEYADYKPGDIKRKERDNSNFSSINFSAFGWVFYVAIALAVVYLVYILFNEGGTSLFSSKQHKKINQYQEITSENIENTNIDALIANAEKNLDFRLAIRYYYLLVLKSLSLKNYIKFEDDKTNSEYLNELNTQPFKDKFAYTSYLYNYIWYGEFLVDLEQYNKAKTHFVTLLNQVKR